MADQNVYDAVYDAVVDTCAGVSETVYEAVVNAVEAATWTVLPRGSHLRLYRDGKWSRGAGIVGMKTPRYGSATLALTERGATVEIDDETNIVVGGGPNG